MSRVVQSEKMRDINPFALRMPPDVRDWIAEQAAANRRSLNSEILTIMEEVRRTRTRQEPAHDVR